MLLGILTIENHLNHGKKWLRRDGINEKVNFEILSVDN